MLENATAPDFDYLNLDPLDPPLRRDPDQAAEDAFCQALLRLGATWWDSCKRREFVDKLREYDEEAVEAVQEDPGLEATRRERGWVRVAWPSHTPGALCVLECVIYKKGRRDKEKGMPSYSGLISLARTMDERCLLLQKLGGKMYASIEEYSGSTFIKALEDGHSGEKGSLVKEYFNDHARYGGHPEDALNLFVKLE